MRYLRRYPIVKVFKIAANFARAAYPENSRFCRTLPLIDKSHNSIQFKNIGAARHYKKSFGRTKWHWNAAETGWSFWIERLCSEGPWALAMNIFSPARRPRSGLVISRSEARCGATAASKNKTECPGRNRSVVIRLQFRQPKAPPAAGGAGPVQKNWGQSAGAGCCGRNVA